MMTDRDELVRRALVMRRVRAVLALLIPVELYLYVAPPGVQNRLNAGLASVLLVSFLLAVTALSAAMHRRVTDPVVLQRWAWAELAADNFVALAVLQTLSFDQYSANWTILVIVALEGAFRGGLRGAMAAWVISGSLYGGIQVFAAVRFPDSAPLDLGSILFRALVTGAVAFVAGQLASQLQEAVERHRASEVALAEQYADLQLIGRVSRAIAAGPQAREEVCRAVAELSGADVVMLYEPYDDMLRCTAAAGAETAQLPALALTDVTSGAARAYHTSELRLIPQAELPAAFAQAPYRWGTPASAAFVPVVGADGPIGALTLTFSDHLEELPRRVVVALQVLAEEAAVAITRADFTAQLADQARRDPLTGLVNRRGMEESIEAEMSRSRRTRVPMTLLMLDLDGLKVFNDTYGHEAGDRLITAAGAAWSARLRPTDVLARYGGDEFVALLPGCDEQLATRVAEALIAALPPGGACSVGIAEWDRFEDLDNLLKRADAALYAGKRTGGNRAVRAVAHTRAPAVVPPPRAVDLSSTRAG